MLLFCREQYPKNEEFAARLVEYYYQAQSDKAIELARELHEARPEHPHWAYVLGRVLINRDAKEALPYLEQAYGRDQSGDLLFELGRCHQVLGNREESVKYHWENLEQDPMASSSLTALVVQGESDQRIWPFVNPAIEAGLGVHEEYFHVSAVMVALSVGEALTSAWISGAVRRVELLQTYPGFRDERRRLRAAVRAWEHARPQDRGRALGRFERMRVRLLWPGTAWVPKDPKRGAD